MVSFGLIYKNIVSFQIDGAHISNTNAVFIIKKPTPDCMQIPSDNAKNTISKKRQESESL